MTEARVNLAARQDDVGTIVRQKQLLDRVSAVLCDDMTGALGEYPPLWWRGCAMYAKDAGLTALASRCEAIADLVEETNL